MKKYLDGLRRNRDFKATEIIQSSFAKTGIRRAELDKGLFQEIALIQNRTRGPLFELMAEVIIGKVFTLQGCDRQKVLSTPYGDRKIDIYIPSDKVAIEVKSGYARSTAFTRKQIQKDKYLLEYQCDVKRVVWFCFRGATDPIQKSLKDTGIEYCDIEYDSFEEQVSETEKIVIRV